MTFKLIQVFTYGSLWISRAPSTIIRALGVENHVLFQCPQACHVLCLCLSLAVGRDTSEVVPEAASNLDEVSEVPINVSNRR